MTNGPDCEGHRATGGPRALACPPLCYGFIPSASLLLTADSAPSCAGMWMGLLKHDHILGPGCTRTSSPCPPRRTPPYPENKRCQFYSRRETIDAAFLLIQYLCLNVCYAALPGQLGLHPRLHKHGKASTLAVIVTVLQTLTYKGTWGGGSTSQSSPLKCDHGGKVTEFTMETKQSSEISARAGPDR